MRRLPDGETSTEHESWVLRGLMRKLPIATHDSDQRGTVKRTFGHAVDEHVPGVDSPVDLRDATAELLADEREVEERALVHWELRVLSFEIAPYAIAVCEAMQRNRVATLL